MFKKLLNSLMGNNETPSSAHQHATTPGETRVGPDRESEETDDDESDGADLSYDEAAFNAEVEARVQALIDNDREDGETPTQQDIDNYRFNVRRQVWLEWTGGSTDEMIRWEHANSMEFHGTATSGFEQHDDNNPLLAPIHGISLQDYGAMCSKVGSGVPVAELCKAMGIETPVWEEVNTLWPKRMQEDGTFTVTTLFGKYFGEANQHPKVGTLQPALNDKAKANIDKINSDRYFYEELCGARQAAYEYGLDGAQWVLDEFGIPLGDMQSAAVKWMAEQNQNWNSNDIQHYMDYQLQKQQEYAARFAKEQGGNIADDVAF